MTDPMFSPAPGTDGRIDPQSRPEIELIRDNIRAIIGQYYEDHGKSIGNFHYQMSFMVDPEDKRVDDADGFDLATLIAQEADKLANKRVLDALDKFEWRIDCNTGISELYGWKSVVAQAKDQTIRLLELDKGDRHEAE